MNKQMLGLILVIVIIVVGLAFYQFKKSPEVVEPVEETPVVEGVTLENGGYTADTASSALTWTAHKTLIAGYTDTGAISLKDGSVKVESGQIMTGQFVVDMTSIKVGSTSNTKGTVTMLEKHLKSADFFDVVKFATSSLMVNKIEMIGGQYIARGDLTIKGITNPIEFPVILAQIGDSISVTGEAVVDRTKWDVRYGSDKFFDNLANNVIDDNFTLKFDIKLGKKDSAPEAKVDIATTTTSTTKSQ